MPTEGKPGSLAEASGRSSDLNAGADEGEGPLRVTGTFYVAAILAASDRRTSLDG